MNVVNKIMTYCFNDKPLFDDKEIYDYIINIHNQTYEGPMDFETFQVWTSPGFTFYNSSNASVIVLSIEDIVAICCIINNRVYYWYLYTYENKSEYDNFMFGMKYPVLANLVYNLYYEHFENPIILKYILYQTSWKIFPIHKIFCRDYQLQVSRRIFENTNLMVLELCIENYGEYDQDNFSSTEMYDYKPYDVTTIQEYEDYKITKKLLTLQWEIIKRYLFQNNNIDFIFLEYLLVDIRMPFQEESYKFIQIALENDQPELYKWVLRKYRVDKSRLLKTLDQFVPNQVFQLIKSE
jgi:hypothetical protein